MVNFTLPFTKNEMILISTSQTFRSWVVIFHLRRTMAFYLSAYMIRLRARRLSSILLKQGYLMERLQSSFRKFYGRYADLIQQYEVSLSRMINDILTLYQLQWFPNRSDFPPIFMTLIPDLTFAELRVVSMEGSQRVRLASRERLPFRTPGSVPLLGTCLCSNCWDQFYRTCRIFFRVFSLHLEYPSVLSRFCLWRHNQCGTDLGRSVGMIMAILKGCA